MGFEKYNLEFVNCQNYKLMIKIFTQNHYLTKDFSSNIETSVFAICVKCDKSYYQSRCEALQS